MNGSRHHRVQELFLKARDLPENERPAFLKGACPDDPELAGEVVSLLDADQDQELLADPVAVLLGAEGTPEDAGSEQLIEQLTQRPPAGGRYQVVREVGRGGMASVLLAFDRDLRRSVAMKVADPGLTGRPGTGSGPLSRFREEAQITGQLDHPGIVPVHEFGVSEDGIAFFAMRLVRGEDLSRIFERTRSGEEGWSRTRALGVLLRVCEAVAYAHAKGVIHRDLKPSNVMVGRFGEVYVMDWGLAKVLGREDPRDLRLRPDSTQSVRSDRRDQGRSLPDSPLITMDGHVVGTPCYMSLEQAEGRIDELGPRSDVYSLGAMLYELLAGQPPYLRAGARPSPHTILAALLDRPPQPIHQIDPSVPPELIAIAEKAMTRDPERRYATTKELAEDLRAFLEHRVVKAWRTGAAVEFSKWVQRNRVAAMAAGLLLVSVIGFLGGLFLIEQSSKRKITDAERETSQKNKELVQAQEEKDRHLADLLELSGAFPDLAERQALLDEAKELWPDDASAIPRMRDWLDRMTALVDRSGRTREVLERAVAAQPGNAFLHRGERGLAEHFAGLRVFEGDPTEGIVGSVRERLAFAELLARDLEEHADEWEEVGFEIEMSDRYGFPLSPQWGLRPLTWNLDTQLFEFRQLLPLRTASGALELDDETGPVLVLLPGGLTTVGAQSTDPDAPYYDAEALPERPMREVRLDPFFLATHEITQGQWRRMVWWRPGIEAHPSRFPLAEANPVPALSWRPPDPAVLPVEQVSFDECTAVLTCFGLVLPTEAQWEYGARGGTDTTWWTGGRPESVGEAKAGNTYDRSAFDGGEHFGPTPDTWADGARHTSPVGQYSANGFGLFDTIGNVFEWCQDDPGLEEQAAPLREGDGLALVAKPSSLRAYRGGGWNMPAAFARSAHAEAATVPTRVWNLGLRPTRPLMEFSP